jgi:hypothetical protein
MLMVFRDLVAMSVGKKEGNRLVKSAAFRDEFMGSEAYSTFFMEILQDGEQAAAFFENVFPKEMAEELQRIIQNGGDETGVVDIPQQRKELPQFNLSALTDEELVNMSQDELAAAFEAEYEPKKPKGWDDYTRDELLRLPEDQFKALLPKNKAEMTKTQLVIGIQRKGIMRGRSDGIRKNAGKF